MTPASTCQSCNEHKIVDPDNGLCIECLDAGYNDIPAMEEEITLKEFLEADANQEFIDLHTNTTQGD
jgi:hypothetical protein